MIEVTGRGPPAMKTTALVDGPVDRRRWPELREIFEAVSAHKLS